jgi:hypothetical protein
MIAQKLIVALREARDGDLKQSNKGRRVDEHAEDVGWTRVEIDQGSLLLVLLLYDRVKASSAIECLEAERGVPWCREVKSVLDGPTLKAVGVVNRAEGYWLIKQFEQGIDTSSQKKCGIRPRCTNIVIRR